MTEGPHPGIEQRPDLHRPDLHRPGLHRPDLHRDGRYVRIWLVGWFTGIVRWLELLAFGIFAFEVTGSPLLVAVIALIRFLPMALLSLPIGAAADQISPRRMLSVSLAGTAIVTAGMLAVHVFGTLTYGHLAFATVVSGIFWAADMPLRRKMIGEIAGPDRLARAMSFDYATSNGTRMLGPLMGGLLYQGVGMGGVFAIGLVLYLLSLVLALGIGPTGGRREGVFRPAMALVGAARAARRALRENDVTAILAVTVIFNLWGFPFVSMIPVIGEEELALSPSMIGLVASIEGATGLFGAVLVGMLARPNWYRRLYFGGALIQVASVFAMGIMPGLTPLCIAMAVAGLATAGFAGMQATLIYTVAPKGMRGRYLGLISICIGTGLVGFANIGWMAELYGAQNALWIVAAEGLVAMAVLACLWRGLWAEIRGIAPTGGGKAAVR